MEFTPTLPDRTGFLTDSVYIERTVREVAASGAVAQIEVVGDGSSSTVRVVSIEGAWVTMRDYDDLMQPYGLVVHRLSRITGIRAGTAYEEADEFLAAIANQSVI